MVKCMKKINEVKEESDSVSIMLHRGLGKLLLIKEHLNRELNEMREEKI